MSMVGYARVSSYSQNIAPQVDKLELICDKVFSEKKTGTLYDREGLKSCMSYLREGDTLVITRLDRLARSTLHLCQIADMLDTEGINLKVLDQNIDTSTATGRLLFNMLGAIGQFETEIRKERQQEGIRVAKSKGVKFGRQKALNPEQVATLQNSRKNGETIKTLCIQYELSKMSIYRYLKHECVPITGGA